MSINLDAKDKALLYELDTNSRQSFRRIGKKIGLDKASVVYRINNLKRSDIIRQFHTVIDIGKLGYICFRLYVKLQNATSQKEAEIINYLNKKENVIWLSSIEGEYNIAALVYVKKVEEMNILWKEFVTKYINYLDDYFIAIVTRITYFSRAYIAEKKQNMYEIVYVSEQHEEKIDELDIQILKLLAHDSRIPIIEISKKTGVTSKTVIARIKELEKREIIIGYKTMFDIEKLGYIYFKLHIRVKNIDKKKEQDMRNYIRAHPNIIYNDEILGGDFFEIELQVKNVQELRKIIEEIRSKFSQIIKDYKVREYYKEHKYIFLPVNL